MATTQPSTQPLADKLELVSVEELALEGPNLTKDELRKIWIDARQGAKRSLEQGEQEIPDAVFLECLEQVHCAGSAIANVLRRKN